MFIKKVYNGSGEKAKSNSKQSSSFFVDKSKKSKLRKAYCWENALAIYSKIWTKIIIILVKIIK